MSMDWEMKVWIMMILKRDRNDFRKQVGCNSFNYSPQSRYTDNNIVNGQRTTYKKNCKHSIVLIYSACLIINTYQRINKSFYLFHYKRKFLHFISILFPRGTDTLVVELNFLYVDST
jgi:hypothetical protein